MRRERLSERGTGAFERLVLVAAVLVIPTIAIENAGLGAGWTHAAS